MGLGNQRQAVGGNQSDPKAGLQFNVLQLQRDGLTVNAKRVDRLAIELQPVGKVSLRRAAERGDVEGCIVEQVFELLGQRGALLCAIGGRELTQIEIVRGLGVVVSMTGFEKLIDRILG